MFSLAGRVFFRGTGCATPPKTNILNPKSGDWENDFPFQAVDFEVPCLFLGCANVRFSLMVF